MLIKKVLPAAITAALLSGTSLVQAQEEPIVTGDELVWEIAGNVALVSDYRFRGISQSDEDWAIQGGFDASWSPGFYVGIWGSSVDFDTNVFGFDGSLELDYYAGWASQIGDSNWGVDVGYIYYDYPGDDGENGDYQEIYGSVSWHDLSVGIAYSDDYYGDTGDFYYYFADYSLGLPANFSMDFHIGYNDLDKNGGFLANFTDSYVDYSIGLGVNWVGLDWGLTWVGTDLDEEDVFDTEWAEDTVVFSVAKAL